MQGQEQKIAEFLSLMKSDPDKPPLAQIRTCDAVEIPLVEKEDKFLIRMSDTQGTPLLQVTADIATCRDCLMEMADEIDFRYGYPFINCTNCGPRYSIIKNIPYDRPNTTMSAFEMCDKCAAQYADVTDRRFHAQPVACPSCGPKIRLTDSKGKTIQTQTEKVIAEMRSTYDDIVVQDGTMEITHSELDFKEVVDRLHTAGATVRSAYVKEPTLDDVFLSITGKEIRE